MHATLQALAEWLYLYKLNLAFSGLVLLTYVLLRRIALPRLAHYVEEGRLKGNSLRQAHASLNLLAGTVCLALLLFIWGFDFGSLLAFSAGLLAITGAALFASWSLLSNVTAFFLLLAHRSYRRGNFIRVIDGDNYVEGYISEINLFNTKLISEQREVIIYPNNLLIMRPTVIGPKARGPALGKITGSP